jgi:hypothetical protein
MSKNKQTRPNAYSLRLAKRVSTGKANISLPVDHHDQPTLNVGQFMPWMKPACKFQNGEPVMRNFSRLRRADEV